MGRPIQKGSTDQSTTIRIIDSTTFAPETAVEHNTAGIDLWWRREGETKTVITEAALAALDSAHSDGGIEHIADGYYRLDLPDAAMAAGTGENSVQVGGTITGMIVIGNEHALVDYDPYDSNEACSGTLTVQTADTVFNLTATLGTLSTQDDTYNNGVICIFDNSGSVYETARISDYDGTNTRITIDHELTFPVQDGVDTWVIYRDAYSDVGAAEITDADKATLVDLIYEEPDADHMTAGTKGLKIHHSGKGRF